MQIPSCKTSCDAVLEWEVFDGRYPASALVGALFLQESTAASSSPGTMPMPSSVDSANVPAAAVLQPLDDEQIPSLVDKFLQHVHTKNPVLDVELLVKHGRNCAKNGVGWDAMSCLVLLACALGSLGLPFGTSEAALQEAPRVIGDGLLGVAGDAAAEHARQWHKHLRQSESCFALACRRLGSLKHTLFGSQCYFFAGGKLPYSFSLSGGSNLPRTSSQNRFSRSRLANHLTSLSHVYPKTYRIMAVLLPCVDPIPNVHPYYIRNREQRRLSGTWRLSHVDPPHAGDSYEDSTP